MRFVHNRPATDGIGHDRGVHDQPPYSTTHHHDHSAVATLIRLSLKYPANDDKGVVKKNLRSMLEKAASPGVFADSAFDGWENSAFDENGIIVSSRV